MNSDSTTSASATKPALSPAPKNYILFVTFIAIIGAF